MKIKKSAVDAYFVLKDKGLIKKASDAIFVGMDDGMHIFKLVKAGVYVEVNADIKTVSQTGKMFSVDMLQDGDDKNIYKVIL